MAGYSIFIPRARGNPDKRLGELGLRGLSDIAPSVTDWPNGPDGAGICVSWIPPASGPEQRPPLQYQPDRQRWESAKKCGERPAGAFWIGIEQDRPPRPDDLAREKRFAGSDIVLEDGNSWRVAAVEQLPHLLGIDAAGDVVETVRADYREFYEAANQVFTWLANDAIPHADGFDFCCRALAVNYRLNRDVIDFLGLLSTEQLGPIAMAAVQFEAILESIAESQKKTDERHSDTSSTSDGVAD